MRLRPRSGRLDGEWDLVRTGGLLPPLRWVRKHIEGDRGWTRVGPFPAAPFSVHGLDLRYSPPFGAFVDVLEASGDGYEGRATAFGHEFGTFRLVRRRGATQRR